jgi:hypothetical protein
MDRRRALATVASLTVGATAVAAAVGATTHVFNVAEASPGVGRISPVSPATLPPVIEHRVVDVEDPAPTTVSSPTPPAGTSGRTATSAPAHVRAASPVVVAPAPSTTTPTVPPPPREHESPGEDD